MKVVLQDEEYDLEKLDWKELKDLRIKFEIELDNIKDQIGRAEALQKSEGIYSDPDWYWSAKRALRHKQRAVQAIQTETAIKRPEKEKPLSQYFVEVANNKLTREVYDSMMAEAKELRKIEQSF